MRTDEVILTPPTAGSRAVPTWSHPAGPAAAPPRNHAGVVALVTNRKHIPG